MPFNELKRQDSFPPTIVHISPSLSNTNKPLPSLPSKPDLEIDIDANPISFFLTTPTPEEEEDEIDFFLHDDDEDGLFDEDLSAGIEGSEEDLRTKDVREISPSSLQREKEGEEETEEDSERFGRALLDGDSDDEEEEVEFGFAMPLSLKDFASRPTSTTTTTPPLDIVNNSHNNGRTSRVGQRFDRAPHLKGLGIDIPDFKPNKERDRGRVRVKLSPVSGGGGNFQGRSVSLSPKPRKPVSWRVPSRGIWRIDEAEEEYGGVGGLSSSAPALTGAGILRNEIEGNRGGEGKKKKRVHWADLSEWN